MTTLDGGDSDLPYEVCELRIALPYILKRIRKQEYLLLERKVLSPDLKESEDAESFERNSQVYLRAIS